MRIEFITVHNFRKLKSCRIDFSEETTIFVGANNSGKTSAMDALFKFLVKESKFTTYDFTISNWEKINKIGERLEEAREKHANIVNLATDWNELLPTLDICLQVNPDEVHYITHLIPTLDWKGEPLGVRLRLEPKDINDFHKNFIIAREQVKNTINEVNEKGKNEYKTIELWPNSMKEFLDKRLMIDFTINAYILDLKKPASVEENAPGLINQTWETSPINGDPLKGLIKISSISAQRGFSDLDRTKSTSINEENKIAYSDNLSSQLRKYYDKHLNPEESTDASDVEALLSIKNAQEVFDNKLRDSFKYAISELEELGYPGFTDPKITISAKIKAMDTLKHNSAVQFALPSLNKEQLRLPEQSSGLGYQNLISMVFNLMRFRDDWMKVGKICKGTSRKGKEHSFEPLHLVLIEEPEAHLHVQVQQVFVRKAFAVLSNNVNIKGSEVFTNQLIISTHSSHIAHETEFSSLRYFRKSHQKDASEVPTADVVSLTDVFGLGDKTARFVTRYIKSTHCDLLFADAVIIVEGQAEKMLMPHFIRNKFKKLNMSYITLLEIGGSHAHRLKPLIEKLGLNCLIITDIDAVNSENKKRIQPKKGKGLVTCNNTLKEWFPCKELLDDLLEIKFEEKEKKYNELYAVRVAYQYAIEIEIGGKCEKVLANTFEDALVLSNLKFFEDLKGNGLIKKFAEAIKGEKNPDKLSGKFFEILKQTKGKAEFALDLFYLEECDKLEPPEYISDGLSWIEERIGSKQESITKETEGKHV
ncbi:MAG: AAA family ATPase [Alkaliphilus sp.]